MERRDLLSVTMQIDSGRSISPANVINMAALSTYPGGPVPPGISLNPATSQTPLIGVGPTPRELAREKFHAVFSGPFYTGPGRFSNQGATIYYRGLGTSNTFLHGDYQMAIVYPTDPSQPLVGEAVLQDKNNNSAGILGLPLTGLTPQTYDQKGRPTEMTFTQDPNIYSGIFFVNTASGTVKIKYGRGSATVVFNGLVYTSGLTSPVANSDLYSRGGRVSARGS